MIFRLSQKLNIKIKAGRLPDLPIDENPYADWSCHVFTADRTHYILISNTASLYSCVMFGRDITDDGQFIERALSTIREFMEDDGQQFVYDRFIAPDTDSVSFAKALNRSVTGSMSDLIQGAKCLLVDDMSPHEVGFELNQTPLSALADPSGKNYASPSEAFKNLSGEQPTSN